MTGPSFPAADQKGATVRAIIDWLTGWLRPRKPPAPPVPPPADDAVAALMLSLHDAERASLGVPPLSPDPHLRAAAQAHADWMAALARVTHAGEGGGVGDRAAAAGYPWHAVAENVTVTTEADARAAWMMWSSSAPHHRNAVNPAHHDAGFGHATGRDGLVYWCAIYGSK